MHTVSLWAFAVRRTTL